MTMKIHHAPNTRSVRTVWLFEELGQPYDIQFHKLGDPEMRSPEYRKIHPMGRVPALEDGDVTILESGAIVEYVLSKYGDGRMRPTPDSARFRRVPAVAALRGGHDHAAGEHHRRRDHPAAARPPQ